MSIASALPQRDAASPGVAQRPSTRKPAQFATRASPNADSEAIDRTVVSREGQNASGGGPSALILQRKRTAVLVSSAGINIASRCCGSLGTQVDFILEALPQ
jgi:hypothetical protein